MMPLLDGWKLIETARAEGIGTPDRRRQRRAKART